ERVPKKSKLITVLLGVTKQSVVKLEVESKEIIVEWKLTQLRRWAASPTSVQTNEGEAISQLISGYIDIILKKRKEAVKAVEAIEEEHATVEEYIKPAKATNVGVVTASQKQAVETRINTPAVILEGNRPGYNRSLPGQMVMFRSTNAMEISGPQQALLHNIMKSLANVHGAANDLSIPMLLPPMGDDPASKHWKQQTSDVQAENITSQIASHLAAIGSLINQTSNDPEDFDSDLMGANISTLGSNIGQISQATKMLLAISDTQRNDSLLDAVRELARTTARVLDVLQPVIAGDSGCQEFFGGCRDIAIVSSDLLSRISKLDVKDERQLEIIDAAKAVARAGAEMVANAKNVSNATSIAETQQQILMDAKICGESIAVLVACAGSVCPTMNAPLCFEQLMTSVVLLRDVIACLADSSESCTSAKFLQQLRDTMQKVEDSILRLIDLAKNCEGEKLSELDKAYDGVIEYADIMKENSLDVEGIVASAKNLTLAATQFVNSLKQKAVQVSDVREKARFVNCARNLADSTSKMVSAAKEAARAVSDVEKQNKLISAMDDLKHAANEAAGSGLRERNFSKLAKASRDVLSATTQLTNAARSASGSNRNQTSQLLLNQNSRALNDVVPTLVTALKNYQQFPKDTISQMKLLNASKQILIPGNVLTSNAKSASATISDTSLQIQLINCVKQTTEALSNLSKACGHSEELSAGLEVQGALDSVKTIQSELLEAKDNSRSLKPLKSQTAESVQLEMASSIKAIQTSINQLSSAATEGAEKQTGVISTDLVSYLQTLSFASKGLAAIETDSDTKIEILGAAVNVADALSALIGISRNAVEDHSQRDIVNSYAKKSAESLTGILSTLPGHRYIERTIHMVKSFAEVTQNKVSPPIIKLKDSFQATQSKLQVSGGSLIISTNNLVNACRGTPGEFQNGTLTFESSYEQLAEAINVFSFKTKDSIVGENLLKIADTISSTSIQFLNNIKLASMGNDNLLLRNELMYHARNISDAINTLMDVCSISAPGQTECNNSLQSMAMTAARLETVNETKTSRISYSECMSRIIESAKQLSSLISGAARATDISKLSENSILISEIVTEITDCNIRAAYLVGASDPFSIGAMPGPIDQIFFATAGHEIKISCEKLIDPENSQAKILECANAIAKITSSICNACKAAGQNQTVNNQARQIFVASAKDVASRTASLVNNIKTLARNRNDDTRAKCAENTAHLSEAIDALVNVAMSSEFSGSKARISSQGIAAQQLLIEPNKAFISAVENVVNSIKVLCANGKDDNARQTLSAEVRAVNEKVQVIVSAIAESAPGQKECEVAMDRITESVATLDSAMVDAAVSNLLPRQGPDKLMLVDNLRAVTSLVDIIEKTAKEDSFQLGSSVLQLPENFSKVAVAVIAVASNSPDLSSQKSTLEDSKDIGDALLGFLWACKSIIAAATPTEAKKLESEKAKTKSAIAKLINSMEESPDDTGEFTKASDQIDKLISSIHSEALLLNITSSQPYQRIAGDIDKNGKILVETIGEVISKAKTAQQFISLAGRVTNVYGVILGSGMNAINEVKDAKVRENLQDTLRELGSCCIKMVDAMRFMSGKNSESLNRMKLTQAAREVSTSVANVMGAAKEGSKGINSCQECIASLNDVITDLEMMSIFAVAGQLDPMDLKDNFGSHKETLLKTARIVTEAAKAFITGIHGSQEELSTLALNSLSSMQNLKDDVKRAATSITSADKHMQQQLLSAARGVAESFQSLLTSAINASGKPNKDPAMMALGECVKQQFTGVRELIRVIKLLGDESLRGIRAIDSSITSIDEIVITLVSSLPAQGSALPDEVAGLAKQLATAAASVVANSHGRQDELVAAANAIKKQLEDLARAAKAATENAPEDKRSAIVGTVKEAATATKTLLFKVKAVQENNSTDNKQAIQEASKGVIGAVNNVVSSTNELISTGYVDQNDPNVIAERELLSAATAIESIAKKLTSTIHTPREDASSEFEGQMLDAAKAIAAATGQLVRSATHAQRDLVAKGRTTAKQDEDVVKYFSDGTWSDGLVSAAKSVAEATRDLCEVAGQAMKGVVPRERIIVASKQVSAATVQLITAAGVRADPNDTAQIRLRAAGKAVTSTTEQLVKAVEEALKFDATDQIASDLWSGSEPVSATSAKVMEMEAQVSILKMEKELEKARNKLAAVRKQKYGSARNSPTSGSPITPNTKIASPNQVPTSVSH
ncbi:Talin-1, partial [Nowakowskiella sp. JEL0078]